MLLSLIFLSLTGCLPLSQNTIKIFEGAESYLSIQSSFPESTTTLSHEIFLTGTVSDYIQDISFYKNTTCSGQQLNSDTNPSSLGSNGTKLILEDQNTFYSNKKYEISAKLIFKSGATRCLEKVFEYKTSPNNPLQFASISPQSPSQTKTPQLRGNLNAEEIKNFKFFSDSLCQQSLSSSYLSDMEFKGGFYLNLEENKNNSIYVQPYLSSEYNYTPAGPCSLFTNYTVDTLKPTTSISTPSTTIANKSNYKNFQISGTCSEVGRTVAITPSTGTTLVNSPLTVSCGPGPAWTAQLDFTGSTGSNVGARVNHSDLAGNNALETTKSFVFDIVEPIVTVTSPSLVNNSNKSNYVLSGSCTNGEGSVSVTIDDTNAVTSPSIKTGISCDSGNWNILAIDAFSVTQLSDGTLTLTASQSDTAGNTGSFTQNISKNTTIPTVTLTTPLSYINNSNESSYSLSGTCSLGANNLSGSLSDGTNTLNFSNVACSSGLWSQSNLDTQLLNEGTITVTIHQSNSAGNTGSKTEVFIKDTTAPSQPIVTNKYYFDLSNQSPNISWLSTDTGTGIENYTYSIGTTFGASDKISQTQTTNNSLQVTLSSGNFEEDSSYYISIIARDKAGNESQVGTSTWIKKTNPPLLDILSPTENFSFNTQTLILSGSCSGPQNISFSITPANSTNDITPASCTNDEFSAQAQVTSNTEIEIIISATQNDGASNQTVNRKIKYTPPILNSISSNRQHSCGIKNGTSYCWGINTDFQLGDGSSNLASSPVKVSLTNLDATSTSFEQISTGEQHSCGLTNDKVAYCWGKNGSGQLGDNSSTNSNKPIKVDMSSVEDGTFMQIRTGAFFSCGLSVSKKVYCWGDNSHNQLGNSPEAIAAGTTSLLKPTLVTIAEEIKEISLSDSTVCALSNLNNIWCWGYNFYIYGNGAVTVATPTQVSFDASESTPAGEIQTGEAFTAVSIGSYNACALSTLNDIFCWGFKQQGILGVSTTDGFFDHPYKRISTFKDKNENLLSNIKFKKISLGSRMRNYDDLTLEGKISGDSGTSSANPRYVHACAISTDNKIYCWGSNNLGQLGINKSSAQLAFTEIPTEIYLTGDNSDIAFSGVSTGTFHTCAIGTKNNQEKIFCWGSYFNGKLGLGADTVTQAQPVIVPTEVTSWPNP